MKSFYIIHLFLFAFITLSAQYQEKIYLDEDWQECKKEEAVYYRIAEDMPTDDYDLYLIKDYFMSGQIQMEGTFFDEEADYKHGDITWYFENGNKRLKAHYESNSLLGDYLSWYDNGNPRLIAEYLQVQGYEVKHEELMKITSFWDSTGVQKVSDGNGIYYTLDQENKLISEGPVVNGYQHGKWKGRVSEPAMTYEETYLKGILVEGKSMDDQGNEYQYKHIRIPPAPKAGLKAFYKVIMKKLKYPKEARKKRIQGKVYVEFVVDKNGAVTKPSIKKGIGYGCDDEVLRVLSESPEWIPGKFRGKIVQAYMILPITFRLE